jgi:hypothetical protein
MLINTTQAWLDGRQCGEGPLSEARKERCCCFEGLIASILLIDNRNSDGCIRTSRERELMSWDLSQEVVRRFQNLLPTAAPLDRAALNALKREITLALGSVHPLRVEEVRQILNGEPRAEWSSFAELLNDLLIDQFLFWGFFESVPDSNDEA